MPGRLSRRDRDLKRQYDQAIADARANLAEIARIRQGAAVPRISTPSETASDVASVVRAELARARQAEREAAERAETARFAHPDSGCAWCGRRYAALATESGPVSDWHTTPDGAICGFCRDTLDDAQGIVGEAKVTIARGLLDVPIPLRAMGDVAAFDTLTLFFVEHEGVEPSWPEGWLHVDVEALRAQWNEIASSDGSPPPAEPEIMRGERCEECGGTDRFVTYVAGARALPDSSGYEPTSVPAPGACADCSVLWMAQATGRVPEWWLRRKGTKLPAWAKQLLEVPA
jgi:hypothetical protein